MSTAQRSAAALILLAALSVPLASAHGYQVGGEPTPLAATPEPPSRVVVLMSEPIEPAFSRVRVVDGAGVDHARGAAYHAEGNASTLAVDVALPGNGTYIVDWEARWRSDGHDTTGSFAFAVGEEINLAAIPPTTAGADGPDALDVSLRTAVFLGGLLAAGSLVFFLVVDRGALPSGASRARALALAGAALLAAASLTQLVASTASGFRVGPIEAIARIPEALDVARLSRLQAGRILAALAALALLAPALRAWRAIAALGAAAVALWTVSAGSHAASEGALLVAADLAHLAAAAAWVGGLPLLALALREEAGAGVARRFSRLAMASVALVVATGAAASFAQLEGEPARLVSTTYGRVLLAKLMLVVALLGFGAFNQLLVPRARDAATRQRLRTSAKIETLVAAVVLVAAGALSAISPTLEPTTSGPLTLIEEGREIRVTLLITPASPGINQIDATIVDKTTGRALDTIQTVTLETRPADASLGTSTTTMRDAGNGTHRGLAGLTVPGEWVLTVYVQRSDAYEDAVLFLAPI